MSTELIKTELDRIYGKPPATFDPTGLEDFGPQERDWYGALPAELRGIAEYIGFEESFPHEHIPMLYGPYDIVEWNSEDGSFGQLRNIVDDYPYDRVVLFGENAYLDVAGQIAQPGAVVTALSYELENADVLAPSLLAFLRQAGTYVK